MKFGGIGAGGNWNVGGALSPAVPKVSGWSQAGSILSLIGGAIAKTSKDRKTQSIGHALQAIGGVPMALHNPGLTDDKGGRSGGEGAAGGEGATGYDAFTGAGLFSWNGEGPSRSTGLAGQALKIFDPNITV